MKEVSTRVHPKNKMFEQAFKNIDDVLWKEAGCTTELDYTEQTSWLLFLKYLDDLEQDKATRRSWKERSTATFSRFRPMLTGEIRNQIDRIWDAFWSGGISNPLEVIEQITYLLFIRRLDDLETLAEKKARVTGTADSLRFRPDQQDLRWSRFKNFEPAVMFTTVVDKVFPFLRDLGGDGSTYSEHMRDARFTIPTAALLSKVVDMLDDIPMADRDTNGDLYEYLLSKIASAGMNGQFRTPRHIIKLMV